MSKPTDEQELLSFVGERLRRVIIDKDTDYHAEKILAKLKAMGYEQVWTKCSNCNGYGTLQTTMMPEGKGPKCIRCKGTGKITKYKSPEEVATFLESIAEDTLKKARGGYVKWDKDKVAKIYVGNSQRIGMIVADRIKEMLEK